MKHLYLVVFLFVSFLCFGQNSEQSGEIAGFKLYPNPVVDGKVYIHTKANSPKQIYIFDVLGTQVLQTTILREELNLSSLEAGIYVIRVFEKDKVATRKLIVK